MTSAKVRFILVWLLCFAFLGCRSIHNFPWVGPQIGDLFPTKDRYARIVEAAISLDKSSNSAEAEFVPPFRGGYIVSIARVGSKEMHHNLSNYITDEARPLAVTLQLIQDEVIRFNQTSRPNEFRLYFGEFAGFQFGGFECPKDIDFGRQATMRVQIVTPDKELEDMFGPFVVFIRKVSDF